MPRTFDVLVVGGGITGAGILRDCAMRGLSACLVEKGDPSRGTTANSSHLIHGGLRYLLYDRIETHLTAWDSGHILRIAGPLLTRLPIVWPVYRDHRHGMETVEALLEAYDPFQVMKGGRPHLRLSAEEVLRLFPGMRAEGLVGGLAFDEWWVDPTGLVKANLESAKRRRAEVLTWAEAADFIKEDGKVCGAKIRYTATGREEEIRARVVVNAGGPWAGRVAQQAGAKVGLRLRQGTHLVYDKLPFKAGLLVEAVDRERVTFLLPFGQKTLVGPTDVECPTGPDGLKATEAEIAYLLGTMKRYFPDFPEKYDRTIVGARPILSQATNEKLLSRDYEVFDHAKAGIPGFVTLAGGKMSSFRKMASDLTDLLCVKLARPAPCRTHLETLWGEPVKDIPDHPLPSFKLKAFLARHPRIRELHALAYLGVQLVKHLAAKFSAPPPAKIDFASHFPVPR